MKYYFIITAKYFAKFIYIFLKMLATTDKIVMISRVNSKTSIDFILIEQQIKKIRPNIKVVILNHKLRTKYHLIIDVLKEMYHLATSRYAIIDSYIIPVSILKHKKNLKIIQIWHSIGVSKRFGYTALGFKEGANKKIAKIMDMHKNYDYLIASGESSIKFYEKSFNISRKKILSLGIPRIDYLVNDNNNLIARKRLYNKYNNLEEKKNILYAPTFRKGQKIPYSNIIKEVDFSNYNLIIKKHHLDKTIIEDNRVVDLSNENILDLLFVADYLITDYSALMFEASLVELPMFFYIYDIDVYQKRRGITIDLKNEAPGFVSSNSSEIINAIKQNNFNIEKIRKFKKLHIDCTDGNATKRIVNLLNLEGGKYENEN